ncbi:MAG: SEC-C metal-binding domain-containing protein [Spirochaetota bacterium]
MHWLVDYLRGLHWLRHHEPLRAMTCFERALMNAPTDRSASLVRSQSRRKALASLFYYLAVCLRKTGMRNRAVGSWVESARLEKRGHARRKLMRVTNAYGMARQPSRELDDQQAFYGVQLARYVRSKQSHRLGTRAEIDMIAELIDEYWHRLRDTLDLSRLSCEQKLALFRETLIVFPFMSVPDALKTDDVTVDFCHGRKPHAGDRCVCGSGLPFRLCHGRTPGTDEALIGKF